MKRMKILLLAFGVALLGSTPARAGQNDVTYRHISKLSFRSCVFEANIPTGLAPEKSVRPDILFLTRIYESGLSEKPAGQLERLRNYFRLPELSLREESNEVEITWHVYEEGEKKRDEIKKKQKIRQVVMMNGDEYTIFVIPQEINIKDNFYQFLIEIYKVQTKQTANLASTELLVKKEVLWNFRGPLAVGFFFPDKVCFLTLTIWAGWSSLGPRLGAGMKGII